MIEVTLNENLRPCERQAFPVLHPLIDLIEDPIAARHLIRYADRVFQFGVDVVYSGFVRKLDAYDGEPGPFGPCCYIQIWHKEKLLRTVGLRDAGYVGVVHVEADPADYQTYFDKDFLGAIFTVLEDPEDATRHIGYVSDFRFEVAVPFSATSREILR